MYLNRKIRHNSLRKKEFENWYAKEHLNEGKGAFMTKNAKRGWIKNTNFLLAIYEFENYEDAEKAINSKNLEIFIKKFDFKRDYKVKRKRKLTELI